MKIIIAFFVIVTSLISESCTTQRISFPKQEYTGNELRIDGFYFCPTNKRSILFYQNGVVHFNGSIENANNDLEMKMYYNDYYRYKSIYDYQFHWGLYKIQNNILVIEIWQSGDEFSGYPTAQYKANIITCDSFQMISPDNGSYKFHYLELKPDSTNKYIK